jgi:hypothetical protein
MSFALCIEPFKPVFPKWFCRDGSERRRDVGYGRLCKEKLGERADESKNDTANESEKESKSKSDNESESESEHDSGSEIEINDWRQPF